MIGDGKSNRGLTGAPGAAAILIIVGLTAILTIRAMGPPRVVPSGAPADEFSAERAFVLVKEIAVKPHPLGTPAHDEVRDRILKKWRDLGFEPFVQKGHHFDARRRSAARLENILVKVPGAAAGAGHTLMLMTHYDSVEEGPGAADDAAGVAALLETARALQSGPSLARDVIILITDGEEDGLLGARLFQAEHPWAKDVGLVLNFEARGSTGPSLMFQTSAGNRELISDLAFAPHPRAYSISAMIYRSMPNNSDLSVWLEAGVQGLNFAFIGRPYDYHTAGDSPARLDLRSLQHHGSYALALARRFGNEGVAPPARGDAVYFNLIGDLFIRYSRMTAVLIAVVIALILAGAGLLGFRRGLLRLSGILRGFVFLIGSAVVSGGLASMFFSLIGNVHKSVVGPGPIAYSGVYFLAALALTAAATTFLHGCLRARVSGFGLAFGAAILFLILAILALFLAVDASYLAAGSALFLALSLLAWAARRKPDENKIPAPPFSAAAPAAVGVVFIALPMIDLLFVSMFLSRVNIVILAVLAALAFAAMTPAIEIVRRGLGRALPVLFAGIFIVLTVVGALTVRYDREIPRLVSFQYLQNFDTGQAYWVTSASPNPWVVQAAGGEFQPGHPLPEIVARPERFSHRPAPLSTGLPPDIKVIGDTLSEAERTLRVRVVSPRGGRRVLIACKTENLVAAELEGRPLALSPESATGFGLSFLNPGPEGFELKIVTGAASPVRLAVWETNPELPDLPGFAWIPPPSDTRPDRVVFGLFKSFLFPALERVP